ncbi:hypothetical protein M9Y10_003875 [Tritrichomonas musculus]|uniref:Uncharacterized protein n=1 Tax=Tritrichomonas musculus TaxID=1915356 RepID=A0ABR2JQG8_9EUKA
MHLRPLTRYIDTDVGFLNQLRFHLPPDPLSNAFEVLKHESLKKHFNKRLEVEHKRFEQKKADDEFFKQLYLRPDPLSNPLNSTSMKP